MTSGRQSATARATACDPSIWLRIDHSRRARRRRRAPPRRQRCSARRSPPGSARESPRATPASDTIPVIAAKPPSSAALARGRPRCSRAISLAGTVRMWPAGKRSRVVLDPQGRHGARRVDQDVGAGRDTAEDVDLVEERRILDDERVRLADRLADTDLTVVDPAVGDDWGSGALRSEGREMPARSCPPRRRRPTGARPR